MGLAARSGLTSTELFRDRATSQHGTSLALALMFNGTSSRTTRWIPLATQVAYARLFGFDLRTATHYVLPEAIWSNTIVKAMAEINATLESAVASKRTDIEATERIAAHTGGPSDPDAFLRLVHRDELAPCGSCGWRSIRRSSPTMRFMPSWL